MKKIFYLKTCSTCQRILKEVNAAGDFELQEIKTQSITEEQFDQMAKIAGSYEALFSRKALKYRAQGLHKKALTEADYRELILKEYTFLKRPVILIGTQIFVGNSKKVVDEAVIVNRKHS